MASSQTGSGKSATYFLPILNSIEPKNTKTIKALILAPTRELCTQIHTMIESFNDELKVCAVFGGVKIAPQINKFKNGIDILVATPGRLLEHIKLGHVELKSVKTVVFDEADRILDMGFLGEIKEIVALLPQKRQTLLFSVRIDGSVKKFSDICQNKPLKIELNEENKNIKQLFYGCDEEQKLELLSFMIGSQNITQALVFTKTKAQSDTVSEYLNESGLSSLALHGGVQSSHRKKAIKSFIDGKIRVLVATDIASRGLDIEDLPCVINFELPSDVQDYTHRIGRTGRNGKSGTCITLLTPLERPILKQISKVVKRDFKVEFYKDYEPKRWPKNKKPKGKNVNRTKKTK